MRSPNLTFGPYNFDPNSRLLSRGGAELPLPPRVIGVLEVLLRRAGDVVPRQELIENVWKDAFVTDTSLAEAVSALRQALGDDAQTPVYVQTLHRRGYRFVAPVASVSDQRAPAPAASDPSPPAPAGAPSIHGALLPWSLAGVCLFVTAAALWHSIGDHRAIEPPVARFVVPLAPGTRLDGRGAAVALAPDAQAMAWSACDDTACRLYLRRLDRTQVEAIAATEGAASPFFSPDRQWLGFFADGQLKKVALAGGAPTALADAPDPLGGVWLRQGGIVYAGSNAGGLTRIADDGGEQVVMTQPRSENGEAAHAWPSLSPQGDVLLFTILPAPGARTGRLGALQIDALGRAGGWQTLMPGMVMASPATDDAVLAARGGELHAAWFDRRRLALSSAPPSVVTTIARAAGGAQFAVSRSGALLIADPGAAAPESLAWMDAGADVAVPELDRPLQLLTLSPDGTRAAGVEETDGSRSDVWTADLSRGTTTRVTHGGENTAPVWAGTRVYYAARVNGVFETWKRDADAAAPAVKVYSAARDSIPVAASPDGAALAFVQRSDRTHSDVWLLPLGGGEAAPLVQTPFEDRAAAFSRDGAFVAYQSSEAGRWNVYAMRRSDGKRTVVSRAGGTAPIWSPDGARLYYRSGRELVSVPFDGRGELRVGAPQPAASGFDGAAIGISPAGRILVRRPPLQPTTVVLTLGWARELRQLLGPPPAFVPR
jgi:serine/threonine-protein kinase